MSSVDIIRLRLTRSSNPDERYIAQVREASSTTFGGEFKADIEASVQALDSLFKLMGYFASLGFNYADLPCKPGLDQIHKDMVNLGDRLWDLLPPPITQKLPHLLQNADLENRRLRLIIEAHTNDRAARLLGLPWELLYLPESGRFPASGPKLEIVRRVIGLPRQREPRLPKDFSLLHHIVQLNQHSITNEAIQTETTILPDLLADNRYHKVPGCGSIESLLETLQNQPVDVFHFLGHGDICHFEAPTSSSAFSPNEQTGFQSTIHIPGHIPGQKNTIDTKTQATKPQPNKVESYKRLGRSYLILSDQFGDVQYVTADHLKHLFANQHGVRLVVLSACQSGSSEAHNIALNLVHAGFPYVVAMQGDLPQRALPHFTRAFYQSLAQHQDIPRAVAWARHEIACHVPDAPDWCLPILYTNEGLPDPPKAKQYADHLASGFSLVGKNKQRLFRWHWQLAAAHILVAVLLTISNLKQSVPDFHVLGYAIAWTGLFTPFIAISVQWRAQTQLKSVLGNFSNLALFGRLWGMSLMTQGLLVMETVIVVSLFASLGFWQQLSPVAHYLLLSPVALLGLFLPYAQSRANVLYFLSSERVVPAAKDWRDLMVISVGYAMLWSPFWIQMDFARDMFYQAIDTTFPTVNLILGLIAGTLAFAIHQLAKERT